MVHHGGIRSLRGQQKKQMTSYSRCPTRPRRIPVFQGHGSPSWHPTGLVPFSRRSTQGDRPRLAMHPRHPLCRVSRGRLTANATRPAPQHLRVDSRRSHDRLCERVLGFQRRRAVKRSVLGTCTVAALIRGVQPLLNKGISMKLKHVVVRNFKGIREVEFPSDAAPTLCDR